MADELWQKLRAAREAGDPSPRWEPWVEERIREAVEQGEFSELEGAGRPLEGIDRPHDDLWWVKQKLRAEGASLLPETLEVRREVEDQLALVMRLSSEKAVRQRLDELNERIARANARSWRGPPTTLGAIDVEAVVTRWRAGRAGDAPC